MYYRQKPLDPEMFLDLETLIPYERILPPVKVSRRDLDLSNVYLPLAERFPDVSLGITWIRPDLPYVEGLDPVA